MFTWILLESLHQSMEDMNAAEELFIEVHQAEFLCSEIGGLAFDTKNNVPDIDQQVLGIAILN